MRVNGYLFRSSPWHYVFCNYEPEKDSSERIFVVPIKKDLISFEVDSNEAKRLFGLKRHIPANSFKVINVRLEMFIDD